MQVVKVSSVENILFQVLCGSLKKNKEVLAFMDNVNRNPDKLPKYTLQCLW